MPWEETATRAIFHTDQGIFNPLLSVFPSLAGPFFFASYNVLPDQKDIDLMIPEPVEDSVVDMVGY